MNKLQEDLLERFAFFMLLGPIVIFGTMRLFHFMPLPFMVTGPLIVFAASVIVVVFRQPWFYQEPQPTPDISSEESADLTKPA